MMMTQTRTALAKSASQFQPVGSGQLPPATVFTNTPAQAFAKLPFPGLATETERRLSTPKHESNPKLDRMIAAWKTFADYPASQLELRTKKYACARKLVRGLKCTADELEQFVATLPQSYNDEAMMFRAGYFISALISTGPDRTYTIRTTNLDVPIYCLGTYNNRKRIFIEGDAGRSVGLGMTGGSIQVSGNAEDNAGEEMAGGRLVITGSAGLMAGLRMSGGTLSVGGDAGAQVGYSMNGGKIIVRGSAGWFAGDLMSGGEIHIGGGCEYLAKNKCDTATVFVGGKQVFPPLTQELDGGVV